MAFKEKWKNRTDTPTYNSWRSMRNRVLYDSSYSHKFYKEKAIKICDEWVNDFDKFYDDMGERPFGTSLDRIDPNGNYEKSNCRWASDRVQQNNKDSLTAIEKDGVLKTIGEWAFELELTNTELRRAYKRHSKYGAKTFEEIFCKHLRSFRKSKECHECEICKTTQSTKWRIGLCANCYAKALRWKNKTGHDIQGYAKLIEDQLTEQGR